MYYSLMASSLWENITNYFANFDGATNSCRTVFLWLTVALIAAFIICKAAIQKESQEKVNKISLAVAIFYSAASIITFVILGFTDDSDGIVALTFYPLLVFIICCIVGGLLIAVYPKKGIKIGVAIAVIASFVAVLVCMTLYYTNGDAADHNWVAKEDVNEIGLYISAVALAAAIIVIAFISDKAHSLFDYDSRTLSFAGVCVALAFALSYVRIFKMPMGGSITLASTLPIMLFSYMYGSKKGIIAGLIYGALQAVQDAWLLHPAQFLLDYGVAFAGIGVAGCIKDFNLFKNSPRAQFILGAVVGGALRFASHFFAGAFAFGSFGASYAEEYGISALSNPYLYSLIYQTMYVIPDVLITICAGAVLFSSKSFVKQLERYSNPKQHSRTEATDAQVAEESEW